MKPTREIEEKWIEASKVNVEAFQPLYELHFDAIFRFLWRRTDNESIASDLTSEVFCKTLLNIHKFKSIGLGLGPYLYKIASHELAQWYRNQKKLPVFVLNHTDVIALAIDDDEENIKRLEHALSKLSSDELELLQLKFYDEKTFSEIAFIQSTTLSAAKMKYYRLVKTLKKNISLHDTP